MAKKKENHNEIITRFKSLLSRIRDKENACQYIIGLQKNSFGDTFAHKNPIKDPKQPASFANFFKSILTKKTFAKKKLETNLI